MSEDSQTRNVLLRQTLQAFQDCSDLSSQEYPLSGIHIVYFNHLVGQEQLRKGVPWSIRPCAGLTNT
ncbi:hypothetical protein [Cohnella luojiensis]|uniref:Uncharacterized protein n=1 Tax=Cohnella luojiensis TaxID=652876 RepID=A0A4Y8M1G1_9BACL|nr:hypothetical protein [Cohnella luojiensis]TFE27833.1 hypothetical protein E2980_08605 [Cohnella luojiensis]